MKFAWKVFFSVMIVIVTAFSFAGYALNSSAFDEALAQEKQKTLDRMTMLMTVVTSFSQNFSHDSNRSELVSIMQAVATGDFASAKLYDSNKAPIYPANAVRPSIIAEADKGIAYELIKGSEGFLMRCCAPVQLGVTTGFLYLEQDVSAPFALYDSMIDTWSKTMIAAVAILGAVIFLISVFLTRPIRQLSFAARLFAAGDYDRRARILTRDEVGDLTRDFNGMADSLQKHMRYLEEEAKQRENFVSSFAHELKTPLTSIIGYADMLRSQRMDDEKRFISANYIFTEGRRLERLSLKLLELMVMNRREFEKYAMEVSDIENRLRETAGNALMEKYGVLLKPELPDATLRVEPDLAITMLINLVDNAAKASKAGQMVVVKGSCRTDGYLISVTDEGIGIPKEEISRITEAFYMVDKSRSRVQNGAGLGLALCSTIANLHGSKLNIESELNRGTVVSVLLPYDKEDGNE
ncbi:MAG: Alkaline phosphatase synthesis sensor protein PhoR [Firmicutes bacterium ADurb.Bin182]|nr:MAG: Alkaline phosphatase synthesis sensor protein PhoR [Firmicutes bacterium ADurb.Bin182]